METDFKDKIGRHILSLPIASAQFKNFSTSPYVLLFQSLKRNYSLISEIESDVLPAKVFSSMETSAGRMIEEVVLPYYGWECVASEMHSANSALDGKKIDAEPVEVVTLKSGPRCLNDEMAENFADSILNNVEAWAEGHNRIRFTYGVLYGTEKQSNKKDWHILRNIEDKIANFGGEMLESPNGQWHCAFRLGELEAEVTIRVGGQWWSFLGGNDCALEVWSALIRACVLPGQEDDADHEYEIIDLSDIVSTSNVSRFYNVSLLQQSQLPWLFLVARHFCDQLVD